MLAGLLLSTMAIRSAQAALTDVRQPWPYAGPLQVDTINSDRGPMVGYNRCTNSTQDSMCVNTVVNSDFCIYAPPQPNSVIGNVEGECVAWCNTPKYNTRVIPAGAITGMLVVKTPGYLAVAANLNGPLLNVQAGDSGGELDPHGADLRGNPIGALMYSNAFGGGATGEQQIIEWHSFISADQLCMKACVDPTPGRLCDNVHDTSGCGVNVPLPYDSIGTTFRQCLGDNQLPPSQNLGASIYTPAISSCTTFASSQIFANAAIATSSASAPSTLASGSSGSAMTSMPTQTPSATSTTIITTSARGAALPTRAPAHGLAAALAIAAFAVAR